MIRWIANAVVVLGCGYLGIAYSKRMDARIRQLEILEQIFVQLGFNIGFLAMPFSLALKAAAKSQQGVLCRLFGSMAERMIRTPNLPPKIVFQEALEECKGVCLKQAEVEVLEEFMSHAGQGDRENTMDGIRMTEAKLKLVMEQALAEREKDGKLWRSMGFLTGLLLVILLV
ncbi:MAG: stage III sporulation protein AB [Clostridia bacterium]|nr:stage III sporulation protein AB [Clostridia bacterium]